MTDSRVWKVYVPHELFVQSESFLFGHVNQVNQSAYITSSSCDQSLANHLPEHQKAIGKWTDTKTDKVYTFSNREKFWIRLIKTPEGEIVCNVFEFHKQQICTCIIFNPKEILQSVSFNYEARSQKDANNNIYALVNTLNESARSSQANGRCVSYCGYRKNTSFSDVVIRWLMAVLYMMYFPFKPLAIPFSSWRWTALSQSSLLGYPSCLSQLASRIQKIETARNQGATRDRLVVMNVLVTQLLDSMLGVSLMYVLMSGETARNLASACLANGDNVAEELRVLLDWLMGAPAGLKLNSPLTHFLGRFFMYHIYLWKGYLSVLRPHLGGLLYYCSTTGVLGLTVQLALFQDILSTMTIHIYCFYVYAARLYRLQMYALGSLWRLFRGKKWNVLRQRVDSAVYDADQLFVGTLLFTVLLFLVPTTALYYVVFTLLRILVLAIQGCVYRLRYMINTTPWWYIVKWLAKSPSLLDGVVFNVVSSSGHCLVLSMQGTLPSLSSVIKQNEMSADVRSGYSWGTIVGNLIHGDLIYPWIERKK